jgi:hypothetical protein
VNAPANIAVDHRETWITTKFRDGTSVKHWGDPEAAVDWAEFEPRPEPDEPEEPDEIPAPPIPRHKEPIQEETTGRSSTTPPPQGGSRPALAVRMADVDPEPVEWLWEPYIPKGKLTSIEGDPGVGKSSLTMALAAQISRGEKLPGVKQITEPASVLLLTAEDGPADTIRPRLDAAGADVDKVHAITTPLSFDKAGAATLKREIERVKPALVIIDPIVAYLPDRTDMNSASAVRPVLARLAKVAEETGVAIAFVHHLAKAAQNKVIYRGLGSIDFTAACRSVLMVGFDPNGGDSGWWRMGRATSRPQAHPRPIHSKAVASRGPVNPRFQRRNWGDHRPMRTKEVLGRRHGSSCSKPSRRVLGPKLKFRQRREDPHLDRELAASERGPWHHSIESIGSLGMEPPPATGR